MRKLVSVLVLAVLTAPAAFAAPTHIARDTRGGYNVTYDYNDKAKTGWYIGGRVGVDFLNFKNEYSTNIPGANDDFDEDKYSFEPVFNGSLAFGRHFNYFWRAELEAGYVGQFTDKDNGFEYKLSAPYLMANGYYDFTNGVYLGAGVGIAVPTTELDGDPFISGDRKKTSVSPMAGVMLGWARELDYNLVLDVRYRLAGFGGHTQKRDFEGFATPDSSLERFSFENKNGLILDNSFTVGLRYEF